MTDADGEQNETRHWIETAVDCRYLPEDEATLLLAQLEEIGRMLGRMIARAADFQGEEHDRIKESSAPCGALAEFLNTEN